MLPRAVTFIAGYVFLIGAMMYANTGWLGWGDPKFGKGGWTLYWPFWVIALLPTAASTVAALWTLRRPRAEVGVLAAGFLVVIGVAVEASFVLNANFPRPPGGVSRPERGVLRREPLAVAPQPSAWPRRGRAARR